MTTVQYCCEHLIDIVVVALYDSQSSLHIPLQLDFGHSDRVLNVNSCRVSLFITPPLSLI